MENLPKKKYMEYMGPKLDLEYEFLSNKHKSNISSMNMIEISELKGEFVSQDKDAMLNPKQELLSENKPESCPSNRLKTPKTNKLVSPETEEPNYNILPNSESKQATILLKSPLNESIQNDIPFDLELLNVKKSEEEDLSPSKMLKTLLAKEIKKTDFIKNLKEQKDKKKSFGQIVIKILGQIAKSNIFSFILMSFTIYALFADDVRILAFTKENDQTFDIIALTAMGIFSVEIFLNILCQESYFNSFFFYLDVISTLSLLFDVIMFQEAVLMSGNNNGSASTNAAQLARVGRASRIGTRAARIVRLVRLIRIVKLYKSALLNKQKWEKKKKMDWIRKNNSRQSQKNDPGKIFEEILEDNVKMTFDDQKEKGGEEIKSANSTAKGKLSLFFGPPKKNSIKQTRQSGVEEDLSKRQNSSQSRRHTMKEGENLNEETEMEEIENEMHLKESTVGKKLSELTTKRVIIIVLILIVAVPLFDSKTYTEDPLYDVYGFYFMAKLNVKDKYFSKTCKDFIDVEKNQRKPTFNPDYLRSEEKDDLMFVREEEGVTMRCVVDLRADTKDTAVLNISRTIFVCLVLTIGTMFFSKDAHELVLHPIERMIDRVNQIAQNPLGIKKIRLVQDKKNTGHELILIENSILKIGTLLALGFGEAGQDIIANNTKNNSGFEAMMKGKRKMAVYGFCDIRNFTDSTEVLQEDVMLFVNNIAAVVHQTVDRYMGAANKNIGDAFLLVWSLPDPKKVKDERDRTDICDLALLSFLKIISKLNRASSILQYRKEERLLARFPSFKVKMGFGLHMGWAIEGAIGSEYKIDVSYLSPNVNLASRLEAATKQYGVPLLISHELYDNFSVEIQSICRKIDVVTVKGSKNPLGLFTVDVNIDDLPPEKVKNIAKNELVEKNHRKKNAIAEFYEQKIFKTKDIFLIDKNIKFLLRNFESDAAAYEIFNAGYNCYLKGDWHSAKLKFQHFLEIKKEDGPARTLLEFMKRSNWESGKDWMGYRELTEKNTEEARNIKKLMTTGAMVPMNIVIPLLLARVQNSKASRFLIDGFPRNLEQALQLESSFREIEFILNFDCPENELVARLSKRAKTSGRADDNDETIRERIKVFNKETRPVIDFYSNFGKVHTINSIGTIQEIYSQVLKTLQKNVIFLYGAPCLGKTILAKKVADKLGYTYFDLHSFYKNRKLLGEEERVNALMKTLQENSDVNFVVDSFFENAKQLKIYLENFALPKLVVLLDGTKDIVEEKIRSACGGNTKLKLEKSGHYESFLSNRKEILSLISKKPYFLTIDTSKSLDQLQNLIINNNLAPEVFIGIGSNNPELCQNYINELILKRAFTHIDMEKILAAEVKRNLKENKLNEIVKSSVYNNDEELIRRCKMELLNRTLFHDLTRRKFIITNFKNDKLNFETFEASCTKISQVISFSSPKKPMDIISPPSFSGETLFFLYGKHMTIDRSSLNIFDYYTLPRNNYYLILSPPGCGKTTVSKYISSRFDYKLIDWEETQTKLKEKLGGENGPLEELPFIEIINYFNGYFNSIRGKNGVVFDGFPFTEKELELWLEKVGQPTGIIELKVSKEGLIRGHKRKNEMDAEAEVPEEEQENIIKNAQKTLGLTSILEKYAQDFFAVNFYSIDGDISVPTILKTVNSLFFKKVYVVSNDLPLKNDWSQNDYLPIFSNICCRNNVIFVDVRRLIALQFDEQGAFSERLDAQYLMNSGESPRDFPSQYTPDLVVDIIKAYLAKIPNCFDEILLFNYPMGDYNNAAPNLHFPRVIDEISLIENALGPIRMYFYIHHNQAPEKEFVEEIEEFPIEEKPVEVKKVEGEEEVKEEEAKNEDEEGKPKFNPRDYQWTISDGRAKNAGQVYTKMKEPIWDNIQIDHGYPDCAMIDQYLENRRNEIKNGTSDNYFCGISLRNYPK